MKHLPPEFTKFENWCKNDALPFWGQAALAPTGGVYECLEMDGTPIADMLKRVRVQARYAYVYAHAGALGWHDNAKAISDHAWKYVLNAGSQGDESITGDGYKGCAHLLNPDDSLHDGLRDTYAQAFIILAGAWRSIAFGDTEALDIAKQTLDFLDTHLKSDNGGWLEGLPLTPYQPRRQNPHMHLFEAIMVLYDATKDPIYLDRVGEIYTLFKSTFFDAKDGTIIEFFNQDWSRSENNGGPVEPGHMMEWCWLLREYENRSGIDVSREANALYKTALDLGFNQRLGLLYDCVHVDGEAPDGFALTLRTWPQTELLKASMAQAKAGEKNALTMASNTIKNVFATYLDVPVSGGWADQINTNGAIISTNMPTSTFYHFFCAAAEVSGFIEWHANSGDA